jgi:hypothetical protein
MRFIAGLLALAITTLLVGDPAAATVTIRAGDDLQLALNNARPGDTILLERGATFTGNFVLPARTSDDEREITLRTAQDEGLPGEGVRMTPEVAPLLAKIRSPNNLPALQAAPGTRRWRILLIHFPPNRNGLGDIIALGDGSSSQSTLARVPSFLTLDRLYIHGDPQRGQKRGIALNSSDTTIINSHISDMKGVGQDTQAICGWNGPGRYLIENNYLEAAGENIMFGGTDPAIIGLTPTRITIRRNTISKPLEWRDPGAPRWQIKNLLELKNARQVVVEQNLFERSWRHAQAGHALVFTVRNQDGGCPWCQVEDVRFQRNIVRDVAAGISILGTDDQHPSRQTNGIVITDNLFDGIDRRAWGGDGYFLALSEDIQDVVIDHNTIIQHSSSGIVKVANGVTSGFTLTNNIVSHGDFGIIGTNFGVGMDTIQHYLPGAQITRNAMAGANRGRYPPGNFFPTVDELRRQFAGFAQRDYRLVESSPWRKAGTDGRDLGASLGGMPSALPRPRPRLPQAH